jgi:hypothetical protein
MKGNVMRDDFDVANYRETITRLGDLLAPTPLAEWDEMTAPEKTKRTAYGRRNAQVTKAIQYPTKQG